MTELIDIITKEKELLEKHVANLNVKWPKMMHNVQEMKTAVTTIWNKNMELESKLKAEQQRTVHLENCLNGTELARKNLEGVNKKLSNLLLSMTTTAAAEKISFGHQSASKSISHRAEKHNVLNTGIAYCSQGVTSESDNQTPNKLKISLPACNSTEIDLSKFPVYDSCGLDEIVRRQAKEIFKLREAVQYHEDKLQLSVVNIRSQQKELISQKHKIKQFSASFYLRQQYVKELKTTIDQAMGAKEETALQLDRITEELKEAKTVDPVQLKEVRDLCTTLKGEKNHWEHKASSLVKDLTKTLSEKIPLLNEITWMTQRLEEVSNERLAYKDAMTLYAYKLTQRQDKSTIPPKKRAETSWYNWTQSPNTSPVVSPTGFETSARANLIRMNKADRRDINTIPMEFSKANNK